MIISPFPYKVIGTDEIKDGCVFNIPNFCAKRQKSMDCKLFYSKLKSSIGIQKCPFGFCAERVQFGDQDIYFTCLNIEKHSKKKDALRRIKNTDFNPRISLSKYEQLKSLFKESLTSNCNVPVEFNEAKQSALLQNEREALDNAIHEINNLTNQLISRADKLSDEVSGNFDRYVNFQIVGGNSHYCGVNSTKTFTTTADSSKIRFWLSTTSGKVYDATIKIQLEKGETATDYEAAADYGQQA